MTNKIPLFLLVGPTGVGKTSLSIDIAEKLNGEIISADSMQIYKYMNIGTDKISENEMNGIPHYLIDIIKPDEDFTVADYKIKATKCIENIYKSNKLPMVVGGTGLYINSLVYDLSFTRVPPNDDFRNKCENMANKYGNNYIYEELKKVDLPSVKRINVNDRKRIIRALEIYYETGKPMSENYKNFRKHNDKYNIVMVGLTMKREELYSKINNRVEEMIKNGLIDEVKTLLDMGYTRDLNSLQGLGYKEVLGYLNNEMNLDETIDLIKRNTRKFAKRQLTWFRRDNRINWVDLNKYNGKDEIENYITDLCRKAYKL